MEGYRKNDSVMYLCHPLKNICDKAQTKGDNDKMEFYASVIQKFHKQLNLPVLSFPELDLVRSDEEEKKGDYA